MTTKRKGRGRAIDPTGAERRDRAYEICTAVRSVMTIWELIMMLVRDHVM